MIKPIMYATLLFGLPTHSLANSVTSQIDTLTSLAGCYLVDYSYSESKPLAEDYELDSRVYDVKNFLVKEWLTVTEQSESSVRLQHFLQAVTHDGQIVFKMRHHGETWQHQADSFLEYQGRFDGNDHWERTSLTQPTWVRKIWNLDDGLRYQCPGQWQEGQAYPTFTCLAFSPIPGRETRDMGRRDYNTLDRTSTVQLFPQAFLERQHNIKTIFESGDRKPLVEEVGKIWSTRLPNQECSEIASWAAKRQPFWDVLAEEWHHVLSNRDAVYEIKKVEGVTRGQKISQLMENTYRELQNDPDLKDQVKQKIRSIIHAHLE